MPSSLPGIILTFDRHVSVDSGKEQTSVASPQHRLIFKAIEPGLKRALFALARNGATVEDMSEWIQEDRGEFGVLKFYQYLQKFTSFGWLCHTVATKGCRIATARPMTIDARFLPIVAILDRHYILSKFAYIHQVKGQMMLESPLSKMTVHLSNWQAIAIVGVLAIPRTSIRAHGEIPITARQLGEFLYRCARIKSLTRTERGETTRRPYPSGGAMYELELYLAVDRCQDLEPGLYCYQPQAHELVTVSGATESVQALLQNAARSMGAADKPQLLIIITARFQRLAWKYESIAYALMLKHVGALYQTMYLVATAMNLAPCGIGIGDSDLFTTAAGGNYYAQTSVGEFALGSRHESDSSF